MTNDSESQFLNEKIHVLDSTAFFAGIPFQGEGKYYTTYQVLDEVRGRGIGAQLIHSRVQVTEPSKESVLKVKEASNRTGDQKSLSEADTSILAVSLDLIKSKRDEEVVLVTDDFAVRNVAEVIGINLSETAIRGDGRGSPGSPTARDAARSISTPRDPCARSAVRSCRGNPGLQTDEHETSLSLLIKGDFLATNRLGW